MSLLETLTRGIEHVADKVHCDLHNDGQYLLGNTAKSDQEWLACRLFQLSRMGCADVRTTHLTLDNEQFEYLGVQPETFQYNCWDVLTPQMQDAWLKLATIVMVAIPDIAERIGHRMTLQAKVIREVAKELTRAKDGR